MVTSDMDKEELSREEIERRLRWYNKRYGSYIEKRGVGNWKNLFRKPNNYEWTILFMLLMAGFIAWAYQEDTATCRESLNNIANTCTQYCTSESLIKAANEDLNKNYSDAYNFSFLITVDNQSPDD